MNQNFIRFGLRYSFRNLFRNRIRTILILATVGFTVGISTVAARYADGVIDLWKNGLIDTGTSHAQLHRQGYWERQEGMDPGLTFDEGNSFEKALAADKRVSAWVRRIRFEGLIATDTKASYFVGIAVDPDQEVRVSPRLFYEGYDEGSFVKADQRMSATIGRGLAELMQLQIGDDATLIARTVDRSENAIDIIVDGIIDVPLPGFSKRAVYLNLDHAQRLMRLGDRYTELGVRLHDGQNETRWVRETEALAGAVGGELRGWWDIDPFIRKVELIWDAVSGLLCALLIVAAALTVINIIFMAVNERVIEIGTLMAIGAKSQDIRMLFAIEGAVIGTVGGVLGCFGGNVIVWFMGIVGIPFESPFGSGIEIVHPTVSSAWIALSLLATVVLCALCAIPPANKAASVEPVIAFRGLV